MKRSLKILSLVLVVAMLAVCFIACDEPDAHVCESKCAECGKCTDALCTDAACANKCTGHTPAHTCEHKCPECNKCTDAACTEDACKDKCQGHKPAAPKLELTYTAPGQAWVVIRENLKETLTETETRALIALFANVELNEGSAGGDANMGILIGSTLITVNSNTGVGSANGKVFTLTASQLIDVTQVFKSHNLAYNDTTPEAPPHACEHKCPTCGKCTDAVCTEAACADKCAGHTTVTPDPNPGENPSASGGQIVKPVASSGQIG